MKVDGPELEKCAANFVPLSPISFLKRADSFFGARTAVVHGARRFTFRSNSALAIEQAVQAGMGIGFLGVVQGTSLPGLVQLDIELASPHIEIFLAFHRDARKTPRVRVVAKEIEADARRQLR